LYHTQLKNRVLDFRIDGVSLSDLGISIKVGDYVQDIKKWAESKGYKIEEIKKDEY
jgi:hypothetical protein